VKSTIRRPETTVISVGVANASLAVLTFGVLAVLLPLTLVKWELVQSHSASISVAYLVVLYASIRLALVVGKGKTEWLHAGFWVFTYVFMGIALLAQIAANRFPDDIEYPQSVLARSTVAVLIGLIAYDLGRLIAGEKTRHQTAKKLSIDIKRCILIGLAGILCASFAIGRIGISPFFASRDALDQALQGRQTGVTAQFIKTEDKATNQLLQNAATIPVFVALYMLLLARRRGALEKSSAASRAGIGLFIAALVAMNLIVNNPLGSSRFRMGLVLIGIAAVFVNIRSKRVFRIAIGLLIVAFLFAFSSLDAFRRTGGHDFSRGGSASEVLLTQRDYGMSQIVHETVSYVDRQGHTMGRQLGGAAGLWVPRRFWPDKPIPTGPLVTRGFIRVASPLWSEGYVDFGMVGTGLVLGAYGWITRRVDNQFIQGGSPGLTALMPLFAGYQFILVRGALIPSLAGFLFLLITARACLSSDYSRRGLRQIMRPAS